jgi:hypothetical protein
VLDQVETGSERSTMLSGQLQRFGYDEGTGAVIVRFDAVVRKPGSGLRKQRFEASEPVGTVDAVTVGAALNARRQHGRRPGGRLGGQLTRPSFFIFDDFYLIAERQDTWRISSSWRPAFTTISTIC